MEIMAMNEHTFIFFLPSDFDSIGPVVETRSWFGTRTEAFNAAWDFSEASGYEFDDAD
jgi:hypothetical protein